MNSKEKMVFKALEDVENQVVNLGYKVVALFVQGSTNYNLDVYTQEYQSDVDMKCFVMPSFEDLYTGNKVSKTLKTDYGQVEVKDVRLLADLLAKMNASYLELLYTDYFLTNDCDFTDTLHSLADELVEERKALLVKSMYGMCLEKQNALCHPYEGLKEKLAQFGGYDPKQMHHACRLAFMLEYMLDMNCDMKDCFYFVGDDQKYLVDLKVHGVGSVEEAKRVTQGAVNSCKVYYDRVWENKQPKSGYEVKSDAVHKVQKLVYELVKKDF